MSTSSKPRVLIVGAGIFGLSTAYYLAEDGYGITIIDQHAYDENEYKLNPTSTAASVDENKIFRASYGHELHYQRLAFEARELWKKWNEERGPGKELFVESGMLRVQHATHLDELERRTQANMTAEGLRDTQFILSDDGDVQRAQRSKWAKKLLKFPIPGKDGKEHFEAVLDTTAGYVYPSKACAVLAERLREKGAKFILGSEKGAFASLKTEGAGDAKRVMAVVTKDGAEHPADLVIMACGSATPMLVPEASRMLEATCGSVVTIALPPKEKAPELWDKYSAENFPVIIGHDPDPTGRELGSRSLYSFPRTEDGLVKIGIHNNHPISVPLRPGVDDTSVPLKSIKAIRTYVSTFMPDMAHLPIAKTRLCFYTDTVDNSFLIDYIPEHNDSLFICTGGSGHGAKFTPILGKYVRDVIQKKPKTELTSTWRWRPELPLDNGIEEGPDGERTLDKQERASAEDLKRAGW